MAPAATSYGWAIRWEHDSRLDGRRAYLLGGARFARLPQFSGHTTMVFKTRQQAREFIRKEYGYIASRPDLRREPHGWKMPRPVKVTVTVAEVVA